MGTRPHHLIALSLMVSGLAGCQVPATGLAQGSTFSLSRLDAASAVVREPEARTQPVAPISASTETLRSTSPAAAQPAERVSSSGGGGPTYSSVAGTSTAGQLTVDVRGFLAALPAPHGRRILETVADVARIDITIQQTGQPVQTATLTAADIANGTVSKTFTGLPTGNAVVLVVASNAAGEPIGSAAQVVVVSQTASTVANLALQLVPPAAGQGPGGTLAANISFLPPDPAIPAGTVLNTFKMQTQGLFASPDGFLYNEGWAGSPPGNASVNYVVFAERHAADDGTLIQSTVTSGGINVHNFSNFVPLAYDPIGKVTVCGGLLGDANVRPPDPMLRQVREAWHCSAVAYDAAGHLCFIANGLIQQVVGATVQATTIPAGGTFALDDTGNYWCAVPGPATAAVAKYAPDGTAIGTYPLPFAPTLIKPDGHGGVWASDRGNEWAAVIPPAWKGGTQLVHVAADGTPGTPITGTIEGYCTDDHQNLWIAEETALVKCAPDGTELGRFPVPARVVTSANGHVFAGLGTNTVALIAP